MLLLPGCLPGYVICVHATASRGHGVPLHAPGASMACTLHKEHPPSRGRLPASFLPPACDALRANPIVQISRVI